MKRIFSLLALAVSLVASAQNANYEQAARFSTKHLQNLVYSTRIRPNWFQNSDKFWYSWKTAEGTKYYIVDPTTGVKTEVFDLANWPARLRKSPTTPTTPSTCRCGWN